MKWRGMATTAAMIDRLFLTICASLVDSRHAVECSTCSMIESSRASQGLSCVSIESVSMEVASREVWNVPRGCNMRVSMRSETYPNKMNHFENGGCTLRDSTAYSNKMNHFERRGCAMRDSTAYSNDNNHLETGGCYMRVLATYFDYNHCDARGWYVRCLTSYLVSVVHIGTLGYYVGESAVCHDIGSFFGASRCYVGCYRGHHSNAGSTVGG